MSGVALVLGAGGLTGQAFHTGVLDALEHHTGWDPRAADLVVGTSAGSAVGAYLRAGLSIGDQAALIEQRPLTPDGAEIVGRLGPSGDWQTPVGPRTWPRAPHPRLLRRLATRPWQVRPETLVAVSLPAGRIPPESWTAALRGVTGGDWPARPLWICAVRTDDGQRVVFGRAGAPDTDVATAVGASCAVPTYFAPVEIGGARYIDGGVHSPTNADVVVPERPDLVIVSSPMSVSRQAITLSPRHAHRLHFRRRLAQEVRRLRNAGIPVVAFQPGVEDRMAMGVDAMDPDRMAGVVRRVRETTLQRLAHGRHAHRLARLAA